MNNFLKLTFSLCACFSLVFSANIDSQEIEEVVVTATKKEESIQDLAISVEAFSASDIDNNMVEDFSDLAEVVPGLIIIFNEGCRFLWCRSCCCWLSCCKHEWT